MNHSPSIPRNHLSCRTSPISSNLFDEKSLEKLSKSDPSDYGSHLKEKDEGELNDAYFTLIMCICTKKRTVSSSLKRFTKSKVILTGQELCKIIGDCMKDYFPLKSKQIAYSSLIIQILLEKDLIIIESSMSHVDGTLYTINPSKALTGVRKYSVKDAMSIILKSLPIGNSFTSQSKKDNVNAGIKKFATSNDISDNNPANRLSKECPVIEEKPEVDPEVISVAGTLEDLIKFLTMDKHSKVTFRDSFVLTYPTFVDSLTLLKLLIGRWNIEPSNHEKSSSTQLLIFSNTRQKPIRIKIMSFVKIWAEHYPTVFQDEEFCNELSKLSNFVLEGMGEKVAIQFAETINNSIVNFSTRREFLAKLMSYKPVQSDIVDVILNTPTDILAQQFVLLDHSIFCNISISELLHKRWMSKDKELKLKNAPHICMLIERFNNTAQWIASIIVQCYVIEQRVSILSRIILLAHTIKEYGDHFTAMAMLAGLNGSAVKRLGRTWDKLDQEDLFMVENLKELYSTDGNYNSYREAIAITSKLCIPYIGLYLRDLVYIDDGNSDFVGDNLINFKKRTLYGKVLYDIKRFQSRACNFKIDESVIPHVVELKQQDESETYDLSLKLEPRDIYRTLEELLQKDQETSEQLNILKAELKLLKEQYSQVQEHNQILYEFTTKDWKRVVNTKNIEKRKGRMFLGGSKLNVQ